MAERLITLDRSRVLRWIREGRTPVIVEGWSGGPFCIVPPKARGNERVELVNEQVGEFTNGYGRIIPLSKEELVWLRMAVNEAEGKRN